MSLALVRKLLRDVRWPLAVTMLLLVGFQLLWVKATSRTVTQLAPFFSTLAARAGASQKIIEEQIFAGPGKIVQTIAGGENVRFERAMDSLTIGYIHPLMQIIFCIWAIGRAATAVAGELDRGTMELLLAQPIPRRSVILSHLAVDAVVIPLIALSLWGGTALGYRLVGPFEVTAADVEPLKKLPFEVKVNPEFLKVDPWSFGLAVWNIGAFLFAVSGLTMALSAAGRFRGRVIGVAVVAALAMFVANIIGQMWDAASVLRPLSLFYYYQPQQIVLNHQWTVDPGPLWGTGPLPLNAVAVLVTVGLVGYILALAVFVRRDLPAPL
jgi:ABC-2 type transport system permease protein